MPNRVGRLRFAALPFIASVAILVLLLFQLALRGTPKWWVRTPGPYPPSRPSSEVNYSAAIIYLAEKRRLEETLHSIGSLQLYIPWRSQWPILLLHTGDFDEPEMVEEFYGKLKTHGRTRQFYSQLRQRLEFVRVEFKFPPGVSPDRDVFKPEVWADRWPGRHPHGRPESSSLLIGGLPHTCSISTYVPLLR